MNTSICIDYLSFEWCAEDSIQAYKELKRKKQKTLYAILNYQDIKQLKKLQIEKSKQARYENVLWRQMAKTCTNNLSNSNTLLDPCLLNWQKESDITWLYGPLYVIEPEKKPCQHNTPFNPNVHIKSILKKNHIQENYWRTDLRYWSKCNSESGKQNVRFNPDIIEIQYISDSPVASQHPLIEHDNEEDDQDLILNHLISSVTYYIKSVFLYLFWKEKSTTIVKTHNNFKVFNFYISTIASTSWLIYQTLLSIAYQTLTNKNKYNVVTS